MSFVRGTARTDAAAARKTDEIGVCPTMSDFKHNDSLARVLEERPDLAALLTVRFPRVACFASIDVAARVTLDDAAHMAEVTPGSLIAFVNGGAGDLVEAHDPEEGAPAWVRAAEAVASNLPRVDASAILASGRDPLPDIRAVADAVPERGIFAVQAPFDPVPLRNLLAGQGFSSHARRLEEGRWRVLFRRDGQGVSETPDAGDLPTGGKTMDLRGLEPPQPLVAILRRIDGGDGGDGFSVVLDRDPVFLYPELEDRDWGWCHVAAPEGEVRLRLGPGEDSGGDCS